MLLRMREKSLGGISQRHCPKAARCITSWTMMIISGTEEEWLMVALLMRIDPALSLLSENAFCVLRTFAVDSSAISVSPHFRE